MDTIKCPRCESTKVKKNGHIHNMKQNYKCLEPDCSRQFVLNPTKKYINDYERDLVKKLLLERISLEGICRVMSVSMTWLLKFIKEIYAQIPNDLNIVINMEDVEQYSENQFNEKIYDLLENKKEDAIFQEEIEVQPLEYLNTTIEDLNIENAIEEEIANELEDTYVHHILENKNSILFNVCPCEADEMWSFVGKKEDKQWIWLAMNITNRQIIGLHIGDRSEESAREFWNNIHPYFRTNCMFFTDFYKPYQNVIPSQNHIAINKSYKSRFTNHIERFNNTIRQRCSRLVRLALSFSKKIENHIGAIKYFIAEYNKLKALHI